MTQHFPLDHEMIVHEGFFDAIQELLGAAAPSLRITVSNATTLKVTAGSGNDQISVAVAGKYRWRTTDTTAALPGSTPDGTHPVFVTASANDFNGPINDPDQGTDYNFGLEIRRTADGNPATTHYRQVGEVDVVSGAIKAFRQTAGPRPAAGFPLDAKADHSSQSPLRVRNSSGTVVFEVDGEGKVTDKHPPKVKSISAVDTTTSTSYVDLGDKVPDLVVPEHALVRISFRANWKMAGASSPGAAAIFLEGNQVKMHQAGQASGLTDTPNILVHTGTGYGIIATGSTRHGLDVYASSGSDHGIPSPVGQYRVGAELGWRTIDIEADAGTYDVGIRWKVADGTLSIKNRKLRVEVIEFNPV